MEFKILGPLEVRQGERRLECRGQKQRLLLGVLLVNANEVVSSDRLTEALWGERPPQGSGKALQVHMSRLRDMLEPGRARGGSGGILVTRPPGYALRVEPGQLDLHRFEQAVGESKLAAEAGRPEEAAQALHEALSLWRGPALADLTFEGALQPDIARLEELRLAALEDRFEADLAPGASATQVVPELEALIAEHPLRQRLRGQSYVCAVPLGAPSRGAPKCLPGTPAARSWRELGIDPSRELPASSSRRDPALRTPSSTAGLRTRPHIRRGGRPRRSDSSAASAELGVLLRRARATRSPVAGGSLLVAGEPGIGKSRWPTSSLAPCAGPRRHACLRRALLGGGRRAGAAAVGAGAARLRARRRPRRAARPGRSARGP